jgi:hypothetical protein
MCANESTNGSAALVREQVEVAALRLQMASVDQARYNVENALARLRIVSSRFEEGVLIERIAAHLYEQFAHSARQFIRSS